MLTQEQNELLTRVSNDAPMGKYMKMFWVPAVRSARLEPGGDPIRVRLFGKNYVAFRGDNGEVGIFNEGCPHRGVSLTTARNEDNALTCLYHGWKFHVSGKTIDAPTEPPERVAHFCKKVPLKSYPVREAGGMVWTYVGEGEPTQFPEFEFNTLPEDHVFVRIALINANWLQVLEGTIDSAHVSILHQESSKKVSAEVKKTLYDPSPRYEVDEQDYGYRAGALRKMPDGSQYVRISEFVQPAWSFIPKNPKEHHVAAFCVPIDDENTAQVFIFYNFNRPLTFEDAAVLQAQFGVDPTAPADNFYEGGSLKWAQKREMLKNHFTGMYGVLVEDYIIVESMGPIQDRTQEYLGSSDSFITRVRRFLLNQVKAVQEGRVPKGLDKEIDYPGIRSTNAVMPADTDWRLAPK